MGKRERSKPTIALAYSDKMLKNIVYAQCYRNKEEQMEASFPQTVKLEMSLKVSRSELDREW